MRGGKVGWKETGDTQMATPAQVKATAQRAGYTKRVIIEGETSDLYAYIKPGIDFEGTFTAIEDYTGEVFTVNGWNVVMRDLDD